MPYLIPNPHHARFEAVIHHVDDEPRGIRVATSPSSRMVVFAAPWNRIHQLRHNLGSVTVAAYLLAGGVEPDGPIRKLYIGETGALRQRLRDHATNPDKGYVSVAYVIGNRAPEFSKSDVQALQFLIDQAAERADRVLIDRGVKPARPELSEERWREVGRWLTDVRRLLVNLGCPVLEPIGMPANPMQDATIDTMFDIRRQDDLASGMTWKPAERGRSLQNAEQVHVAGGRSLLRQGRATATMRERDAQEASRFLYRLNHGGVVAEGYQDGQQFVVIPGSTMRRDSAASFADQKDNLMRRADIISMGITRPVIDQPGLVAFTREHRFRTRAIAAKVLVGVNLKADTWVPIPLPATLSAVMAEPPGRWSPG